MKTFTRTASALTLALALGAPGCGSDTPGTSTCGQASCPDLSISPTDLAVTPPADLAGATKFKFIIDKLLMPEPATAGLEFQYDIDGAGRKRNQLGLVINTLKNLGGTDPQITVDDALAMGEVIQLFQLTATDPALQNDSQVELSGWVGTAPMGTLGPQLFNGKATVGVSAAEEPKQHRMVGALASGKLSTGYLPPAALPLHFPLPGQTPVPLTIYGVHIEGPITTRPAGGFSLGRPVNGSWAVLAGGISAAQIHERLIPAITKLLQSYVDKGDAQGMQVAGFFDTDKNGTITDKELEENPTVQSLLMPDMDLFLDADGTLAPNVDKKRDSLSFGIGFTAVPVSFPDQE